MPVIVPGDTGGNGSGVPVGRRKKKKKGTGFSGQPGGYVPSGGGDGSSGPPSQASGGGNGHPQDGSSRPGNVSSGGNGRGTPGSVQQIIDFFKGKGLNSFAIAGILGNWKVESGFSTTSYNSGEGAHGLANWGRLSLACS